MKGKLPLIVKVMPESQLNIDNRNIQTSKLICSRIVSLLEHNRLVTCPSDIDIDGICQLALTREMIVQSVSETERNAMGIKLREECDHQPFFKEGIGLQLIFSLSGYVDTSILHEILDSILDTIVESEIVDCINSMAWLDGSLTKRLLSKLNNLKGGRIKKSPVKDQLSMQLKAYFEGDHHPLPDKGILFVSSNLLMMFAEHGFESEADDLLEYWSRFRIKVITASSIPVVEEQLPSSSEINLVEIALFIGIIAAQTRKQKLCGENNKTVPDWFIKLLAKHLESPFSALFSGDINKRIFLHHSFLPSFTPYFQIARRTEMLEINVPLNSRDRLLESALNTALPKNSSPRIALFFPLVMPFPNILPNGQKNIEVFGYRHHFIDETCYKTNHLFTHWLPHNLPVLEEQYDFIICICSLIFVSDREAFLSHLKKHLIKGGTFIYQFREDNFKYFSDYSHTENFENCQKLFKSAGFQYQSKRDVNINTSCKLLTFKNNI